MREARLDDLHVHTCTGARVAVAILPNLLLRKLDHDSDSDHGSRCRCTPLHPPWKKPAPSRAPVNFMIPKAPAAAAAEGDEISQPPASVHVAVGRAYACSATVRCRGR